MLAWEQIQKTVDYIDSHIGEEMSLEDLAQIACLSPFYFQRLFHRLVKCPVAEYIKLRRMALAKEALLQKKDKVLDIALSYGFSTHEHFSRTFKSTFCLSPTEYRKNPIRLNTMTKPDLLLHYALMDEGVPLITHQIILEVNRKEIAESVNYAGYIIRMPISYGDGLGVESGEDPMGYLWDRIHLEKDQDNWFIPDAEEVGVMLPDSKDGYFRYFAGTRPQLQSDEINSIFLSTNNTQIVRAQYEIKPYTWELPAGRYVVCNFEAENFEDLVMNVLYKAQRYVIEVWLPKHEIQIEAFCVEYYATHTPETNQMELWMKVKEEDSNVH